MAKKLTSNVFADGKWFGPSYPNAGDPPAGSVGDHAFGDDQPNNEATEVLAMTGQPQSNVDFDLDKVSAPAEPTETVRRSAPRK